MARRARTAVGSSIATSEVGSLGPQAATIRAARRHSATPIMVRVRVARAAGEATSRLPAVATMAVMMAEASGWGRSQVVQTAGLYWIPSAARSSRKGS